VSSRERERERERQRREKERRRSKEGERRREFSAARVKSETGSGRKGKKLTIPVIGTPTLKVSRHSPVAQAQRRTVPSSEAV